MQRITVFDTYEQAKPTLEKYLASNEIIRIKISDMRKEKLRKYRKDIGYDEKIKKLLEKPSSSIHRPLIPLHPSSYPPPKKDKEKILADVGKGLELIYSFDLYFNNGSYFFADDLIADLHFRALTPYATISNLAEGIKKSLEDECTNYNGATLKPFVYTVIEHPKISKEQFEVFKNNFLDAFVEWAMELADDREQKERIYLRSNSLDMPAPRALNEEERAEFENLFFK